MPRRYQEIYPESPLVDSRRLARPGAASLLTLEYFEAEPSSIVGGLMVEPARSAVQVPAPSGSSVSPGARGVRAGAQSFFPTVR